MLRKIVPDLNLACFGALQTYIFTILPYLREKTELSLSTLVLGLSLGTLCFLPGTFFWNSESDEGKTFYGLKWNAFFLSLSVLSLVIIMNTPLSTTSAFMIFLIGRLIWGLGASGITGLTQNIRLQNETNKLKNVGTNSLVLNLGRTMGPALVLLPFSIETTTILFFCITAIVAILNLLTNDDEKSAIVSEKLSFDHSKILLPAAILCFLMTSGTGLVHSGLGVYLQDQFSLSGKDASEFTGSLLLLSSFVMMSGHMIVRSLNDQNSKKLLTLGLFVFSAGLLSFNLKLKSALFITVPLISLGVSFLYPGIIMLTDSLTQRSSRGRSLGIMAMVSTLGSVAGGILLSFGQFNFVAIVTALAVVITIAGMKITSSSKEVLWKA